MNIIKSLLLQILWLFLSIAATACIKYPTGNDDNAPIMLWSFAQSDGSLIDGVFPKFIYDGKIIWYGWYGNKPSLIARDKNSGNIQWQWEDTFDNRRLFINGQIYFQNNTLTFRDGSRLHNLNLDIGKTNWRVKANASFADAEVEGLGNTVFFSASKIQVFSGDIKTGNINVLTAVHPDKQTYLGTPKAIAINNDTLLIIPYILPLTSSTYTSAFILFNATQNKLLYTQTVIDTTRSPGFFGTIIYNNKIILAADNSIIGFDFLSGKELWRRQFPADFLFSGIALAEGKIIGNCEDQNMYALDPDTGNIVWTERTSGTSSRPFVMNGVIYFTGGGDGLLHALDAKTGQHIWKLESPDLKRNDGAWFFDTVTGADGKIYVSSYLSLFCYKAAR